MSKWGWLALLSIPVGGCLTLAAIGMLLIDTEPPNLRELRAGLETSVYLATDRSLPPEPPEGLLDLVKYPAPLGENWAYVSPESNELRPAVVYVQGGFDWGLGSWMWEPAPESNDQTGSVFRDGSVVLMLPSLRGSHDNPGQNECMFGEVDDIIAAGRYLKQRPDVDPERVYLVGHSTGGTLVALVAEATDEFREVFALGPVARVGAYGPDCVSSLNFDEYTVRSPGSLLHELHTPLWIIEGSVDGNAFDARVFANAENAPVRPKVHIIEGMDHFSVIVPACRSILSYIHGGTEPSPAAIHEAK